MDIRYDLILGSRRTSNYLWMVITFIGGIGFFLAGISSYLGFQLLHTHMGFHMKYLLFQNSHWFLRNRAKTVKLSITQSEAAMWFGLNISVLTLFSILVWVDLIRFDIDDCNSKHHFQSKMSSPHNSILLSKVVELAFN